jgi:hypothetical protein
LSAGIVVLPCGHQQFREAAVPFDGHESEFTNGKAPTRSDELHLPPAMKMCHVFEELYRGAKHYLPEY